MTAETPPEALGTNTQCVICALSAAPYCSLPPAYYFSCKSCGTIFQHPMPTLEAMRSYVDEEYTAGVYRDYVAARDLKLLTFGPRVEEIRRRAGVGRLLDIGASCGYFVDAALERGFDAYGVELSAPAVAQAPERLRDRLILGDINRLSEIHCSRYDVVTAFDIIEHTLDPLGFLNELRGVMKPGSWLVLTTPNTQHLLPYVLGRRWPMLQPLQHTVLFSPRSLAAALSFAGFVDIKIGTAKKTLTVDYLARQVSPHLPVAARLYRTISRAVPAFVRGAPVSINIGEMMVFARLPSQESL